MPKVNNLNSCYLKDLSFLEDHNGALRCKYCCNRVGSKRSSIIDHSSSAKHQRLSVQQQKQCTIEAAFSSSSLQISKDQHFNCRLADTFLKTNIPLHKLNEPAMKGFIEEFTQFKCPDESTVRKNYVDKIYFEKLSELQTNMKESQIYLILDETTDRNHRMVLNVMVGKLSSDNASEPYLLDTIFLKSACNHSTVSQGLIQSLCTLYGNEIDYQKIGLIVTDAAPYMIKAVSNFINCFAEKCIHLTCVVHGLHLVCDCVRQQYEQVNLYISKVKKVLVKANQRRALFVEKTGLSLPPEPIITRWGTFLEAVKYHASNFEKAKSFIQDINEPHNLVVTELKALVESSEIPLQLAQIVSCFFYLVPAVKKLESSNMSLLEQLNILDDVKSKLPSNSSAFEKFLSVEKKNAGLQTLRSISAVLNGSPIELLAKSFSPSQILNYSYAPLSSFEVERSFSKYRDCLLYTSPSPRD